LTECSSRRLTVSFLALCRPRQIYRTA